MIAAFGKDSTSYWEVDSGWFRLLSMDETFRLHGRCVRMSSHKLSGRNSCSDKIGYCQSHVFDVNHYSIKLRDVLPLGCMMWLPIIRVSSLSELSHLLCDSVNLFSEKWARGCNLSVAYTVYTAFTRSRPNINGMRLIYNTLMEVVCHNPWKSILLTRHLSWYTLTWRVHRPKIIVLFPAN